MDSVINGHTDTCITKYASIKVAQRKQVKKLTKAIHTAGYVATVHIETVMSKS